MRPSSNKSLIIDNSCVCYLGFSLQIRKLIKPVPHSEEEAKKVSLLLEYSLPLELKAVGVFLQRGLGISRTFHLLFLPGYINASLPILATLTWLPSPQANRSQCTQADSDWQVVMSNSTGQGEAKGSL